MLDDALAIRYDDLAINRVSIANQILGARYDFSSENAFVISSKGGSRMLYVCGSLLDKWRVAELESVTRAYLRMDAVADVLWQLRRYGYVKLCGFDTSNRYERCTYQLCGCGKVNKLRCSYPLDLEDLLERWKGVSMAFKFETELKQYEFRNIRSGVSTKTGKRWMSLITENPKDGTQLDVGVPSEMIRDVEGIGLRKGDYMDMPIVAVSARDYSYVRLTDLPIVYDEGGEVL